MFTHSSRAETSAENFWVIELKSAWSDFCRDTSMSFGYVSITGWLFVGKQVIEAQRVLWVLWGSEGQSPWLIPLLTVQPHLGFRWAGARRAGCRKDQVGWCSPRSSFCRWVFIWQVSVAVSGSGGRGAGAIITAAMWRLNSPPCITYDAAVSISHLHGSDPDVPFSGTLHSQQ